MSRVTDALMYLVERIEPHGRWAALVRFSCHDNNDGRTQPLMQFSDGYWKTPGLDLFGMFPWAPASTSISEFGTVPVHRVFHALAIDNYFSLDIHVPTATDSTDRLTHKAIRWWLMLKQQWCH